MVIVTYSCYSMSTLSDIQEQLNSINRWQPFLISLTWTEGSTLKDKMMYKCSHISHGTLMKRTCFHCYWIIQILHRLWTEAEDSLSFRIVVMYHIYVCLLKFSNIVICNLTCCVQFWLDLLISTQMYGMCDSVNIGSILPHSY